MATVFTVAKWKQAKRPSVNDWIKRMWYMSMEYYLAIKRMKCCQFAAMWVDLVNIMLSETSQRKAILYDITYTWNPKRNTNECICKTETNSQILKTN